MKTTEREEKHQKRFDKQQANVRISAVDGGNVERVGRLVYR